MHCDVRVQNGEECGVKKVSSLRDCASKELQDFDDYPWQKQAKCRLVPCKGLRLSQTVLYISFTPSTPFEILSSKTLRIKKIYPLFALDKSMVKDFNEIAMASSVNRPVK